MAFHLLGTVRAVVDGRQVYLGTRHRRLLLAVLLLEVNKLVPVRRLEDLIWPDNPPADPRAAIQTYVSHLRKALVDFAEYGVSLHRDGQGYVLRCDPMCIDAHQFRTMLDQARACTDYEQRVIILNDALDLWQGPALGSVTSDDNIRIRLGQSLEEARLVALEDRFDAELQLGRHHTVVDELTELTAEHPNRQRLIGQLMVALHRSLRTEDALEVYRQTEQRMADELGLDPAKELKELQLAILRDDPDLSCPSHASDSAPAGSTPVATNPRQLPLDADGFTGRDRYLRHLDDLVADADEHALVIVTIEGTAGVGKTALAVRWAHQLAERYPDGQLFINLRGYGPGPPMSGTEALAQFLRALGVDPDRIPHHEHERSALYRSLLADRRVLVLLDNAADVNLVRPLLPGSPSCLVLITSRDQLGGLAMQGAHQLTLDVLTPDESMALLTRLLGRRAAQDLPAVAALTARVAHLPLALRITAANLLNHPRQTVAEYTAQLQDVDRLDALVIAGDEQGAVRIAFDESYHRLDGNAQRLFRLLGLHPGDDVDAHAAAALAGATLDTALRQLDRLTRAHLIHEVSTGRFQMHDLLRAYAAEQACADEPETARRAALTRLFDFHLHVANAAMDLVYPNRRRVPLCGAAPETELPTLTDYQQAMTWLDAERTNLVAVTRLAASEGWWSVHAWQIPHVLYRFFYVRGYIDDWIATHHLALAAAARSGYRLAEAETLNNLASGYLFSGRYTEAREHYQRALMVSREIGDRSMEASTLGNLALLYLRSGRYAEALDQFQQALVLHRQVGDQTGEAHTLNNLGLLLLWMGRHADAIDYCQQAIALARQIGYHRNEAAALDNLGVALLRSGHAEEAIAPGQQALTIFRQISDPRGEAAALDNLGTAYTMMGDHTQGLIYHNEALDISSKLHIVGLTCEILNHTGTSHRLAGHHQTALDYHTQALTLARDTGERHEQARAHEGIARAYDELGHHDQAIEHWRQAFTLYTELGVPEAYEARSELDKLTHTRRSRR